MDLSYVRENQNVESEVREVYKYYSPQRPVSIGTYPKKSEMIKFENYDTKKYVEEIQREAWGELEYKSPLTEKDIVDYELMQPNEKQFIVNNELKNSIAHGEEKKLILNYFVAECMEFHNLGKVYTDIETIERAYEIYKSLPIESANMGNGLGVIISGFSDSVYDGDYSLIQNGQIDDLSLYSDSLNNNVEILEAVSYLKDQVLKEMFNDNKSKANRMEDNKVSEQLREISQRELKKIMSNNDSFPDLSNCFFRNIEFEGELIKSSDFSNSRFYECTFKDVNLESSNFINAKLTNCEIKNVNLKDTNFTESGIYQTAFFNTDLSNCNLILSSIKGVTFNDNTKLNNIDFMNVKMDGVYFRNVVIESPIKNIDSIYVTMGGATREEIEKHRNSIMKSLTNTKEYTLNSKENNFESEQLKPSYYVIKDLSDWSNNLSNRSKLERVGNINEAIKKFKQYRNSDYDYSDNKAKLTVGVQIGDSEIDIVHVRNNENYLVSDFIGIPHINTNVYFLNDMAKFENEVGLEKIRLYKDERGGWLKEPLDINYKNWQNIYFGGILPYNNAKDIITHGEENLKGREKEVTIKKVDNFNLDEKEKSTKDLVMEQLQNGIRNVMESETFYNWCKTSGKLYFNNYSFRNAMLVYFQKPESSFVMGYEEWKKFGRNVTKGSKSMKIFTPLFAKEYGTKGSFFKSIKEHLKTQFNKDPNIPFASYRLGQSSLGFNMLKNGLFEITINGISQKQLTEEQLRKYIDNQVIGKVPVHYGVASVFDISDTSLPEFLWLKNGFKKEDLVLNENGDPIKNQKGEYKILNTEERQSAFVTDLDLAITKGDTKKMGILFETLQRVSSKNGVPITVEKIHEDGVKGFYHRGENRIAISDELSITEKVSVAFHEMAHSKMHHDLSDMSIKINGVPAYTRMELKKVNEFWKSAEVEEIKDGGLTDKEFVLKSVYINGVTLGYASKELRSDKTVILTALRNIRETSSEKDLLIDLKQVYYFIETEELKHDKDVLSLMDTTQPIKENINITTNLKEVQAEAVACMTASNFGIDTTTSSFTYLAVWSKGRDLKELEKSLDLIYKQSKTLMQEIEKDLDSRNMTLLMEPKSLESMTVEEKNIQGYTSYIINETQNNDELLMAVKSDIEELNSPLACNTRELNIIKEQGVICKLIEEKLSKFNNLTDQLNASNVREEQNLLKDKIEAKVKQIDGLKEEFEALTEERVEAVKERRELKKDDIKGLYNSNPIKALMQLQRDNDKLKNLSSNDIKYIATSRFISRKLSKELGVNTDNFIDNSLNQLDKAKSVLSKNGTFVEVSFCEQWGDTPIFTEGTLVHPKLANKIIAQAEKEIRNFKEIASKTGDYYPYSKCNLTIYTPTEKGLLAIHTSIDIGDGEQIDLVNHIEQICKKGKEKQLILDNFKTACKERGVIKDKIQIPTILKVNKIGNEKENTFSLNEWKERINNERSDQNQSRDDNEIEKTEEYEYEEGR